MLTFSNYIKGQIFRPSRLSGVLQRLQLLTLAVQRVVPGYHSDLGPTLAQASDLIILEATVQSKDPRGTPCIEYLWRLGNKGQQLATVISGDRYAYTNP